MGTAWWGRLDEDDLMRTAWWERLDDENDLMMRTTWWWERLDDENDLLVRWWIYAAIKSFYLILSNLKFRTISRVGFERRTIAKTRSDSSNKNFCPTLGLNRVGLFDMSETQLCGQPRHYSIECWMRDSELIWLDSRFLHAYNVYFLF
jgi:hypothetical protein